MSQPTNRQVTRQIYLDLKEQVQTGDMDGYFDAVSTYATHPEPGVGLPGTFAAFAVEIERQARTEDRGRVVLGDGLAPPVEYAGYLEAKGVLKDAVKDILPNPSPRFIGAIGCEDVTLTYLNEEPDDEDSSLPRKADEFIKSGRKTLVNQGSGLVVVTNELLKSNGVTNAEERTDSLEAAGYPLLVGMALSNDTLSKFDYVVTALAFKHSKSLHPMNTEFALFEHPEGIPQEFDQAVDFSSRDSGPHLRWHKSGEVRVGCPMTFIGETVFRPAWRQVVQTVLDQGYEV